ncbi:Very-long-chain 3-oxoacyl-CoA reductase [Picochlorum sp. SENEW3]|nr:Very-long-chain 3-oxoacyl-CoA reductase [Picochlorum sp. SENEW3]
MSILASIVGTVCTWIVAFYFLGYFIPHVFVALFYKTKNLKKSYNATWGLVTGGSSGIGKSIAKRLASQGLNVVLVALDDDVFEQTYQELKESYPDVTFRKIGVNLGAPGYMPVIAEKTSDIDIQCVFLNAGYVLTGFFDSHNVEKHMANLECNATSAVQITHLLLERMISKKLKGCFVYTSSAAAAIPNPFSVLYASTKSFISSFGASLAAEVRSEGIDVLVIHPSPVATRFYDKAHKLGALEFFKKLAVAPDDLPDIIFSSIGRLIWRDIGPTAIGFRVLMKVLDYNLFAFIIAVTARFTGDFKKYGNRNKKD